MKTAQFFVMALVFISCTKQEASNLISQRDLLEQTVEYTPTKVKEILPSQAYVKLPEIAGNGSALTWDGRVTIYAKEIRSKVTTLGAVVAEFQAGSFSLQHGETKILGNLLIAMQGDGNFVVYQKNVPVFFTATQGKCIKCLATFQTDGNFVVYETEGSLRAIYSTSTGSGSKLVFTDDEIGLSIQDQSNNILFAQEQVTPGWVAKVFQAEKLKNANPHNKESVIETLRGAFSKPYAWAISSEAAAAKFPDQEQMKLPLLNALAIVPEQGHEINPFPSDGDGNPSTTGGFETYKTRIYTQDYQGLGATHLGYFPATIIVKSPKTEHAEVHRIFSTGEFKTIKDQDGKEIRCIEPTVTFDGKLIVFQEWSGSPETNGELYFIYNATPDLGDDQWSSPKSITRMHDDQELRVRYPVARYEIKDSMGTPLDEVHGAYAWISLNGDDIFYSASVYKDGARRSGTSIVGAASKGLIRLLDGGLNTARLGDIPRLFMTSIGKSPGMWSPLEFAEKKVLPLTDKLSTYSLFASNSAAYFEASFEESFNGDYEAYFDMTESLKMTGYDPKMGNYDTETTQDVSGNYHFGTKHVGALFTEEAYTAECTNLLCPLKDPHSPTSKLFSGQPMYFMGGGFVEAKAVSSTKHQMLENARDLSLSFAIRPIGKISEVTTVYKKDNSFEVTLLPGLRIEFRLVFKTANGKLVRNFRGPLLTQDEWSHVALTVNTLTGEVHIFRNGSIHNSEYLREAVVGINSDGSSLVFGSLGPTSEEIVLAIDQVALSKVTRTGQEIQRQAGMVKRRVTNNPLVLPNGLKIKDIESEILLARPLSKELKNLGRVLFFDPRLSMNNKVSCASCHRPDNFLSENIELHDSLQANLSTNKKLLRNTPSVLNTAFKSSFMADGKASDLFAQAHAVITSPEEMGNDLNGVMRKIANSKTYQELFRKAFPEDVAPIVTDHLFMALQEFQLSLMSGNSRFDQDDLSDSERNGKALFFGKARCAECHSGSNFTDNQPHKLEFVKSTNSDGREDLGRFLVTGLDKDKGRFMTPSLRNVAQTAPYFHNGSVPDLKTVVSMYMEQSLNDDALSPIELTEPEVNDLVSFLESLTGDKPTVIAPVFSDLPAPVESSLTLSAGVILNNSDAINLDLVRLQINPAGQLTVASLTGDTLWSTDFAGASCDITCVLVFQADGNLVIYKGSTPLWSSLTHGMAGNGPKLQISSSEPFLRIISADGNLIWTSSADYSTDTILKEGQYLHIGPSRDYVRMVLQGDGNLVIYKGDFRPSNAIWSAGTSQDCRGTCHLELSKDGNLELKKGPVTYWTRSVDNKKLQLTQAPPFINIKTADSATPAQSSAAVKVSSFERRTTALTYSDFIGSHR